MMKSCMCTSLTVATRIWVPLVSMPRGWAPSFTSFAASYLKVWRSTNFRLSSIPQVYRLFPTTFIRLIWFPWPWPPTRSFTPVFTSQWVTHPSWEPVKMRSLSSLRHRTVIGLLWPLTTLSGVVGSFTFKYVINPDKETVRRWGPCHMQETWDKPNKAL